MAPVFDRNSEWIQSSFQTISPWSAMLRMDIRAYEVSAQRARSLCFHDTVKSRIFRRKCWASIARRRYCSKTLQRFELTQCFMQTSMSYGGLDRPPASGRFAIVSAYRMFTHARQPFDSTRSLDAIVQVHYAGADAVCVEKFELAPYIRWECRFSAADEDWMD